MLQIPPWLPGFVQAHRVAEVLRRPESAQWLDESKGMCLYGTIGHDAYLRPDGSVWFYSPVSPQGPRQVRVAIGHYSGALGCHPDSGEAIPTTSGAAADAAAGHSRLSTVQGHRQRSRASAVSRLRRARLGAGRSRLTSA